MSPIKNKFCLLNLSALKHLIKESYNGTARMMRDTANVTSGRGLFRSSCEEVEEAQQATEMSRQLAARPAH